MFTVVTGSGCKIREMVGDVAHYCGLELMPRLENKLFITINLIRNLRQKEGISGDCIWEDDTCTRPREFLIRIDSAMTKQEILETVAHEMVHVKQYARGELKDFARSINLCKWKGRTLEWEKIDYYDQPWEIEAREYERRLFIRWFEQSQWKKCKWVSY